MATDDSTIKLVVSADLGGLKTAMGEVGGVVKSTTGEMTAAFKQTSAAQEVAAATGIRGAEQLKIKQIELQKAVFASREALQANRDAQAMLTAAIDESGVATLRQIELHRTLIAEEQTLTASMQATQFAFRTGRAELSVLTRETALAKEEISVLSDAVGIKMPGAMGTLLARIPALQGAMSALFEVSIILFFVSAAAEAFEKLSGYITGWTDKAKAAYEGLIEENQKFVAAQERVAAGQEKIKAVGLVGPGKTKQELISVEDDITRAQSAITGLRAQQLVLQKTVDETKLFRSSDDLKKAQEELKKKTAELDAKIIEVDELKNVKRPELQATARAETGVGGIALDTAKAEAKKKADLDIVASEEQLIKSRRALKLISDEEETADLIRLEERKLEIEQAYIAAKKALAGREAATGKDTAPEVATLNADALTDASHTAMAIAELKNKLAVDTKKTDEEVALAAIANAKNLAETQANVNEAMGKELLAAHKLSIAEETAVQIAAETSRNDAQRKAITEEIAIAAKYPEDNKKRIADLYAALEELNLRHQAKMDAIDSERVLKEREINVRILEEEMSAVSASANQRLTAAKRADDELLKTHRITTTTWANADKAAIQTWASSQIEEFKRVLEAYKVMGLGETVEAKKIADKITEIERKAADQTIQIDQQVALKRQALEDKIFAKFNSTLTDMITGKQTYAQAIAGIEESMVSGIVSHMAKELEVKLVTWAAERTAKEAGAVADQALTKKGIMVDAKAAAAGAYKAMAGIPIIGPALGAIAAAVTFAAVMAFGTFEKGGVVPTDMLAQVHKGEGVFSSGDMSTFKQIAENGGGGGAGIGSVHLHNHGGDPKQFFGMEKQLINMVRKSQRRGKLQSY